MVMRTRFFQSSEQELLDEARRLTGIRQRAALLRAGLEALIAQESAKLLARLGGTEKQLKSIPRRRPGKSR